MAEEKTKKMPIFAARFGGLRGDRTQAEFAEFLGISRPTVGFYENGERIPDALVLKQIAERCGVTTDYLVGLSDNKTNASADIGNITGLSDLAIHVLEMAKKEKNCHKTYNDCYKYYWSDVLSMLIESFEYNTRLAHCLVEILNLSCDPDLDSDSFDLEDELLVNAPEIYKIIYHYGVVLKGTAYRNYLFDDAERMFREILYYIASAVTPDEMKTEYMKLITDRKNNIFSMTAEIEDLIRHFQEEGAPNADDPETR